jgi:hypothetical protein
MKTCRLPLLLVAVATVAFQTDPVVAEDVYYVKHIGELMFIEGELPVTDRPPYYDWSIGQKAAVMHPYAVLDGPGEIYVGIQRRARPVVGTYRDDTIAIRAPQGQQITGQLFVPKPDFTGMVALQFSVAADEGTAENAVPFLRTKLAHYQRLLDRGVPGAAWFRHQVRVTRQAPRFEPERTPAAGVPLPPPGPPGPPGAPRGPRTQRTSRAQETYALLSGGRALSENLQLDHLLPTTKAGAATVAIDSIEGITVREFEWAALVQDLQPPQDPLASLIPDDQHAIFFPTFQALIDLAENADVQGTPVLRVMEPRAEHAQVRKRYERQLCLPLSTLARLLGPHLVESVAGTGSDPYLRTGADVAILFEAKNLAALRTLVVGSVALAAQAHPQAERVNGEVDGVAYTGMRSPDRTICSYVASLGNTLVVTNSLAQLRRLVSVWSGATASLASLPEFTFFRDRYQRGDDRETALLVISDKTIRRWCGPRWRIGTSRRTRAAAVMTEIQAAYLDHLVKGKLITGPVYTEHPLPDEGDLTLTPTGISSSVYGSLEFQTPIIELDLDRATQAEADLYGRWRDGYQRNWRNYFDPIAVRFYSGAEKLAVDVTVMPLIANTQYREMIDVSRGAAIAPNAGDPHTGTLLHWVLALNRDSPTVKTAVNWSRTMAPQLSVDPLGWLGQAIAVYADDDPFWSELAEAEDPEEFMEKQFHRLPVALHIEVTSGLKLTVFLAGIRAFIEQTAPGMMVWETMQYNDAPFVKITPSELAKSDEDMFENVAVYYAASGQALIVTLNEDVLRRALDRQNARRTAKAAGTPLPRGGRPWLGKNLCIQADKRVVQLIEVLFAENYQQMMQLLAWSNLPILNEWKRLYPESDPVQLHQQFWQRRLVCPGGGAYRWNQKWQTMESTVYGHPGEPKHDLSLPPVLKNILSANGGLTFEEGGLRAKIELEQKAPGRSLRQQQLDQ